MSERLPASQDRGPVQFRYQKDPFFQFAVDEGIAAEMTESGFCWLASTDMAISSFLSDTSLRENFIKKLARDTKAAGLLRDVDGQLDGRRLPEYTAVINASLSSSRVQAEAALMVDPQPWTLNDEVFAGNVVLFSVGIEDIGGHMMVMDRVLIDPSMREGAFGFWNPGEENPIFARNIVGITRFVHDMNTTDLKLDPTAIVFRPKDLKSPYQQLPLELPNGTQTTS